MTTSVFQWPLDGTGQNKGHTFNKKLLGNGILVQQDESVVESPVQHDSYNPSNVLYTS